MTIELLPGLVNGLRSGDLSLTGPADKFFLRKTVNQKCEWYVAMETLPPNININKATVFFCFFLQMIYS